MESNWMIFQMKTGATRDAPVPEPRKSYDPHSGKPPGGAAARRFA